LDKHAKGFARQHWVVETGEYVSSSSNNSVWFPPVPLYPGVISATAIVNLKDGLLSNEKTHTTVVSYTVPNSSDDIPNSYTYYSNYRGFRNGKVNFVKNDNSIIWNTYDEIGRPKANIMQVTEPDFVTHNPSVDDQIKTFEATYNYYTGIVTAYSLQTNHSNEKLSFTYHYDANYRPITTKVYFGSKNEEISNQQYTKMGALKRVILGRNYQGVDYVYTLNGALKAINHPGLDHTLDPGGDNADYTGSTNNVNRDLFGEIVEYYNNDYIRSNTGINSSISSVNSKYDGLIYAQRFKTRNQIGATTIGSNFIDYNGANQTQLITTTNYHHQELRFEYQYDQFNQLAKTVFATYNNSSNTITNRTEYSESGVSGGNIGYDKNGNIERLVRKAFNNVTLDDLSYTVDPNGNKLTAILDAASNTYSQSFNFRTPSQSTSSSFSYNAIGQLVQSSAENVQNIEYMPDGKVKKITFTNNNTTEYEYGADGKKIKSKFYLASSGSYKYTWYIGPYLFYYDEKDPTPEFKISEVKLPTGVLRANASNLNSAYTVYHLTDHLGNVRVTFKGSSPHSAIEVLSYNDYYAFGGVIPGREWISETTRFGYQGQEKKDASNPWYQFELRMYNQDIGRWFAPDPYSQHNSPYLAMSNNPINYIDRDGGWDEPNNWRYSLINDFIPYTPNDFDKWFDIGGESFGWRNGNGGDGGGVNYYNFSQVQTEALIMEFNSPRGSAPREAGDPDYGIYYDQSLGHHTSKEIRKKIDNSNNLTNDTKSIKPNLKNSNMEVNKSKITKVSLKQNVKGSKELSKEIHHNVAQSNGGDPYSNSLAYIPPPKDGLPGFPGAERDRPKGGRPRWKLPNGDIGEWDGQHGEVEVYNPRGKHKGAWTPDGKQVKNPVPGRKTNTFDVPRYNWNTPATSWWVVGAAGTIGIIYTIWKFENPALILVKP
jgi:RHS repeat-associated protein